MQKLDTSEGNKCAVIKGTLAWDLLCYQFWQWTHQGFWFIFRFLFRNRQDILIWSNFAYSANIHRSIPRISRKDNFLLHILRMCWAHFGCSAVTYSASCRVVEHLDPRQLGAISFFLLQLDKKNWFCTYGDYAELAPKNNSNIPANGQYLRNSKKTLMQITLKNTALHEKNCKWTYWKCAVFLYKKDDSAVSPRLCIDLIDIFVEIGRIRLTFWQHLRKQWGCSTHKILFQCSWKSMLCVQYC